MTYSYAQQNTSCGAVGGACSAAHMFALALILGIAAAVSIFVCLHGLVLVRPILGILLLGLILVVRTGSRPKNSRAVL